MSTVEGLATALVGGLIGGAAVAIIGGLITLIVQGREHRARLSEALAAREHERAMAREERLQDRRARAYEAILEHLYRMALWVERTEPIVGPKPAPPAIVADEEQMKLNAITAAHASPEALALVRAVSDAGRDFQVAVWQLASERAGMESGGLVRSFQHVEEARQEWYRRSKAATDRLSAELRGET